MDLSPNTLLSHLKDTDNCEKILGVDRRSKQGRSANIHQEVYHFGWLKFMCDAGTLGAKVESVLEFVNRAVRKMVSVFQFPIQYFPTEILTISLTIAGQY